MKSKVRPGIAMFNPATGTKRCSTVKRNLAIVEFMKNRCTADGYQTSCNQCKREYWANRPRPLFNPALGTKRCSTCEQDLSINEFSKNRRTKDGYQNVCNGCKHDYWNRWYRELRKNADGQTRLRRQWNKYGLRSRLKRYGLTHEQYLELVAHGCAICGGPPKKDGRYSRLAFDHDHQTGEFRGLLCS